MQGEREKVAASMRQINDAWLARRPEDLAQFVDDDIVMVFPGFAGRIRGRESFLEGFRDFSDNAIIRQFEASDPEIDVIGKTAVVSFRYEMVYERSDERYRVTGRDLWVFEKSGESWRAVWRTMLDLTEIAA